MKIKVYIVTYNNDIMMNRCIDSLLNSDLMKYDHEINVINNYGTLPSTDKYIVLNNVLRPDFSTGHLSRNWNQAIVNGFKDLLNPDCDILVCAQNDSVFQSQWCQYLLEYHKIYDFISMGSGDEYHSYTPEAIKNIGLWDERFVNGCSEGDYFLRAKIYHPNKSSINDYFHGRVHNPIVFDIADYKLIHHVPCGIIRNEPSRIDMVKYMNISQEIFKLKWNISDIYWNETSNFITKSLIPNFIQYPYFEKNVIDLIGKNYVVPTNS